MPLAKHTEPPDYAVHVYRVERNADPLPCVICGGKPEPDTQVMECNRGEPRLICGICISLAMIGFEDMDRTDQGWSSLVSPF